MHGFVGWEVTKIFLELDQKSNVSSDTGYKTLVFRNLSLFTWKMELIIGILEFPGGLGVKDSAWSLLWRGFDPWSRNFCMLQTRLKTKPNQTKQTCKIIAIPLGENEYKTPSPGVPLVVQWVKNLTSIHEDTVLSLASRSGLKDLRGRDLAVLGLWPAAAALIRLPYATGMGLKRK